VPGNGSHIRSQVLTDEAFVPVSRTQRQARGNSGPYKAVLEKVESRMSWKRQVRLSSPNGAQVCLGYVALVG